MYSYIYEVRLEYTLSRQIKLWYRINNTYIVDLALIGNLILIVLFSGYENFVSKIDVAKNSKDKPSWMGKVDFSGLKLKLIASIVAISSIGLLEAFIDVGSKSKDEIYLMIYIHAIFIFSGVFIAVMDYIASKTVSHYEWKLK